MQKGIKPSNNLEKKQHLTKRFRKLHAQRAVLEEDTWLRPQRGCPEHCTECTYHHGQEPLSLLLHPQIPPWEYAKHCTQKRCEGGKKEQKEIFSSFFLFPSKPKCPADFWGYRGRERRKPTWVFFSSGIRGLFEGVFWDLLRQMGQQASFCLCFKQKRGGLWFLLKRKSKSNR